MEGVDEEEEEVAGAAGSLKQGLVWDPEEGPVWGTIGNAGGEKQDDTWTQLLKEGISGITTDRDGKEQTFLLHVLLMTEI